MHVKRDDSPVLTVAFSPCPNDTFMFHDLAVGKLRPADREVQVHLHDVETLNQFALEGRFDITKLSFHAYLLVQQEYELLGVGAALGYGCGPIVVARRQISRDDLARCRVAVPGELTTAHLLLQLWAPHVSNKIFAPYDQIMGLIDAGSAEAGVIIHEDRFTYQRAGFCLLADLGQWWQEQTQLPIPLGCIAARRSLGAEMIGEFESLLTASIESSLADPAAAMDYVRQHARQMDQAVLAEHIRTFVNDYSLDLGEEGRAAIEKLRELARQAEIIR